MPLNEIEKENQFEVRI